ncbi:MAG: hypothetical protein IKK21_03540 [Clostridia bacterium]|nr:hypothetical protein [Clostridia bacterium]
MKWCHLVGIILAIALIVFSIAYPIPQKWVYVSGLSSAYTSDWSDNIGAEYLGGDAYNYIVEASLKGNYMSGVLTMKSVTFVGGVLLLFLTVYSYIKCAAVKAGTETLVRLLSKADTETAPVNRTEEAAAPCTGEAEAGDARE